MFDVDMMLDLWMPFWWFNKLTGGMTQTQLKEGRVMGSFDMFRKMISDNAAYYQPDIENIRETKPKEYALFVSQDVKSFGNLKRTSSVRSVERNTKNTRKPMTII